MESGIDLALAELRENPNSKPVQTALKYGVNITTLRRRLAGTQLSHADARDGTFTKLTKVQEDTLISLISDFTERHIPPTSQLVKNFAEELAGGPIGKNWVGRFTARHKNRLHGAYLRNLDASRAKAENPVNIKRFYDQLEEAVEKYHITAENIYNMDEKGFMIGFMGRRKRIMTKEAIEAGRIENTMQDGNRGFISLLATICANGIALPAGLIYQGKTGDLQSNWVEDLEPSEIAYFAATETGWTCDILGLQWLEKVFHKYTKDKAGHRRRLLILDGHSSHINMTFLCLANSLRILILVLPPHITHRLQPLDIGLFSPLSTAYSTQLDGLIANSFGITSMSKRLFWTLFKPAFIIAFSNENIISAFQKSGIWPFNSNLVLDKLQLRRRSTRLSVLPNQLETPKSCWAIRCMQRHWNKTQNYQLINKLFHGSEALAAQHSIDQHIIRSLYLALNIAKKKTKKSQRLNLHDGDKSGPVFWSPTKINIAKAQLDQKEAQEAQAKLNIEATKVAKALEKQEKEAKRQELAIEKTRKRTEAKIQKECLARERQEKAALRKLEKEANKAQAGPSKATEIASRANKRPTKSIIGKRKLVESTISVVSAPVAKRVATRTIGGRAVKIPQRFL